MSTESRRVARTLGRMGFGVAVAVIAVTILDLIAGTRVHRSAKGAVSGRGIRVRKAITVASSPEEAYSF